MTFDEFLSILNGTWIEVAGTSAKNQCVDLANAYIKYVLGLPIIEYTNAVDFPSKAGDKYDWIVNSPTNVPQEGDVVIWGGTYGHVAIFIEGNSSSFRSFDQNYPTEGTNCHIQNHNYTSPKVLGWLHPKAAPIDNPTLITQLQAEVEKYKRLYEDERLAKIKLEDAVDKAGEINKILTDENLKDKKMIEDTTNEKKTLLESLQESKTSLSNVKTELSVCQGQLANRKELFKWTWKERFWSLFKTG